METKGKSELVFSQNNCVSKRGFVVLIKSVYDKSFANYFKVVCLQAFFKPFSFHDAPRKS